MKIIKGHGNQEHTSSLIGLSVEEAKELGFLNDDGEPFDADESVQFTVIQGGKSEYRRA